MRDGTIFTCEMKRGKSTATKTYRWNHEWSCWEKESKAGGMWGKVPTTENNKVNSAYAISSHGESTKPPKAGKQLTFQFESVKAELAELREMVSPRPTITDELANLDVNNETILRPDYIHHDAEKVLGGPIPRHRVFARPEIGGDRHYLYAIPNPDRESAKSWLLQRPLPGVTSILKKTMPTPESLIKWKASFPGGYQAANDYTMLMAARGTIMHGMFADFVNGLIPEFDSPEWHAYVELKMRKQKADRKYHGEWQHFFKKAILSLMQWIQDYEVTIILMEVALVSESLGYAGQLDLICQMNKSKYTDKTPKDKRERVNAIGDFKSGEHSHDSHAVQLSMYVPLVQEHFPGFKIDQVWNWHPSDWRERPNKDGEWYFSYKAIDQSKKLSTEKVNHLLALYAMDTSDQHEKVVSFSGKPELGKAPADMVKTVDFVEHWESTLFLAIDHGLEID